MFFIFIWSCRISLRLFILDDEVQWRKRVYHEREIYLHADRRLKSVSHKHRWPSRTSNTCTPTHWWSDYQKTRTRRRLCDWRKKYQEMWRKAHSKWKHWRERTAEATTTTAHNHTNAYCDFCQAQRRDQRNHSSVSQSLNSYQWLWQRLQFSQSSTVPNFRQRSNFEYRCHQHFEQLKYLFCDRFFLLHSIKLRLLNFFKSKHLCAKINWFYSRKIEENKKESY